MSDTGPLTPTMELEHMQKMYADPGPEPHVHGPFVWHLNSNHNALRGCMVCGQTWVGVMAGHEDDIRWHVVAEPEEVE